MKRTAKKIFALPDARVRAERILPRVLFDYMDGGSADEITLRKNRQAFEEVEFRPRAAAAPPSTDLSTTVFGTRLSIPVVLAPIGGLRLFYPDGDRATMRAANSAGTAAILSTNSGSPLEYVAEAATGPAWFQLYFRGGRDGAEVIVDRAQRAGFGALFVTLDVSGGIPVERIRRDVNQLARLKGDVARDSAIPVSMSVRNAVIFAPQLVRRMRWTAGYVRDGVPTKFVQEDEIAQSKLAEAHAGGAGNGVITDPRIAPPGQTAAARALSIPTWKDLDWIREVWKGPLIAKGVARGDDARRALDHGADGILVSNHGGRQVDGGIATLRALPEVRRAVGDSVPLLIDGGIRRGSHVVKALALGANAAVIGRPYAYGLAAAGEAGVRRILDLFEVEILQTMRALGLASLAEIDGTSLDTSRFFLAQRLAAADEPLTSLSTS